MKLHRRIKQNHDIRTNEPIYHANDARELITTRTRRSRYMSIGLMTLALGFGVMGSRTAASEPSNTETVATAEGDSPKKEPFATMSDIGLIGTLGAAYTERKLFRRSVNQTVERFRRGQGIPSGGLFRLELVKTADGGDGVVSTPIFVGTKTPESDGSASLPSLGAWVSGGILDQAAFNPALDRSIQIGFGVSGVMFFAGTAAVETMMQKNISVIEQDALQRIDQLDPDLIEE